MKLITISHLLTLSVCFVGVLSTQIRQKRAWIIDSFSIEEEYPGPFPYALGKIHLERAYLVNFWLKGSGVDEEPTGILDIDTNKGMIYVHKKIDFEAYQVLRLTFEARNVSNKEVDTRLGVEIKILDINDNRPLFQKQLYEIALDESIVQGERILTVMALDNDDSTTPNGTFTLSIISVSPKSDTAEFFLEQASKAHTGSIYFRGCLDYEKAQIYSVVVEAKDHGNIVQLSSTATVLIKLTDKNNHLPEITGQTGDGNVLEGQSGVEVLRLQVTDKDSKGSDAWKAVFTIHGHKDDYFKIETDAKTNEGILTVIKPMDYELQALQNLSISVANMVPYFSCEVTGRPKERLWSVKTTNEGASTTLPKLYPVTIHVLDVNDPPQFVPRVKEVVIMENTKANTYLYTLKAIDPDKMLGSSFQFVKGEDPDNWVNINSKTGEITTAKVLDRECPLLKNSTYIVTHYAVDNGQPPMTGTGTLIIHVGDENDNLPVLEVNRVDMCLSDKPSSANITAVDADLPPFTGPFSYELLGDVKGKWKIDPSFGTTVNLVKDNKIFSGPYELQIRISDSQGLSSIQNLSVTVCDCSTTPNCHQRRTSASHVAFSAMGIIVLAQLLLLAMLLLALVITCKKIKLMIPSNEDSGWQLIPSNTEKPGTDCKWPILNEFGAQNPNETKPEEDMQRPNGNPPTNGESLVWPRWNGSMRWTRESFVFQLREDLRARITQNILLMKAKEEELGNYSPHCYADEGEPEIDFHLDELSIGDNESHVDYLSSLDHRFKNLALVCMPDLKAQL